MEGQAKHGEEGPPEVGKVQYLGYSTAAAGCLLDGLDGLVPNRGRGETHSIRPPEAKSARVFWSVPPLAPREVQVLPSFPDGRHMHAHTRPPRSPQTQPTTPRMTSHGAVSASEIAEADVRSRRAQVPERH